MAPKTIDPPVGIPPEQLPSVLLRAVNAAQHGIAIGEASPGTPLVYVNDAFVTMTGYALDDVIGRNCRFLQGVGTDPAQSGQIRAALDAGQPIQMIMLNYRKDGSEFYNDLSITPVPDQTGRITHYIGTQLDVTDRVHREMDLARLAHTDPVTGLTSGARLVTNLNDLIADPPVDRTISVILIDLRGFHRVNDDYDFQVGDDVLTGVGERLRSIENVVLLARLEADHFLLVTSLPGPGPDRQLADTVENIGRTLRPAIATGHVVVTVVPDLGTATYPIDGTTASALITAAKAAVSTGRSRAVAD